MSSKWSLAVIGTMDLTRVQFMPAVWKECLSSVVTSSA